MRRLRTSKHCHVTPLSAVIFPGGISQTSNLTPIPLEADAQFNYEGESDLESKRVSAATALSAKKIERIGKKTTRRTNHLAFKVCVKRQTPEKSKMQRYSILLFTSLLATSMGCFAPQFDHTRTDSQLFEVDQLRLIDLTTYNGSITVESHDASDVSLDITYKARGRSEEVAQKNCELLDCLIDVQDDQLTIEADNPENRWFASVSFAVYVPQDCNLILKTSNGEIAVRDMFSDVNAKTSNGAINCDRLTGALVAKTSNGKIMVQGGENSVKLNTSNGKITFAGRLIGDQNEIRTSNGSVSVGVMSNELTEVKAKTSNGHIDCELPALQTIKADKNEYHAIVGQGSDQAAPTKVNVRTSNGSIDIRSASIQVESEQPADSWEESGIQL